MTIRHGMLDRSITIERPATAVGADGVPTFTWSTLRRLRAAILEQHSEESQEARGTTSTEVITFRTSYAADLTLADRVAYAGKDYDITSIKPIGRRLGLELVCKRTGP